MQANRSQRSVRRCYSSARMQLIPPPGSKRLIVGSVFLGIFILMDIALFGWLIFRSLSQREIERVLFEARLDAEELAQQLAGRAEQQGADLYSVTATEQEVQTYIDSILKQRIFVQTVEVVDSEGRVVFRGTGEATFELEPAETPIIETGEAPSRVEVRPYERSTTFPIDESIKSLHNLNLPIGELGFLNICISEGELQRSIDTLRADLMRTTVLIAAMTTAVLLLAYLIIRRLWSRSQKLEAQARERERLAYIGTLASGLAHEIRNPLNSLNLNMQMLEEETRLQEGSRSRGRLLSITRDEIHRLESLVTEFLQYAKPPPLELETLPAIELLDRCRQVLQGEAEALGVRLVTDDRSAGARLRIDSAQMTQLLLNLTKNALAAVEEKGRDMEVLLRASTEGDTVILEVEDHGIGMSQEQLERMFELFYSNKKGGTGLGLAVVQRIARAHGAEIDVVSSPDQGTRVRVILPAAEQVAKASPSLAALGAARPAVGDSPD